MNTQIRKTALEAISLIISLFFFFLPSVFALEKMTPEELRQVTAQSGIMARADDVVTFLDITSVTLQDTDTWDSSGTPFSKPGYLTFDIKALARFDGTLDFDMGGCFSDQQVQFYDQTSSGEILRIFDHPLSDMAMVFFDRENDQGRVDLQFNNIKVFNHDLDAETLIGNVVYEGITVHSSSMKVFAPPGEGSSGICALLETQGEIDRFQFSSPDESSTFTVEGIMFGGSFTGTSLPEEPNTVDVIDTDSWEFDSTGFQFGMPVFYEDSPVEEDTVIQSCPVTFDIATDMTREGDCKSFISFNAPMEGSIRIKNISADGADFGPVAIDGIRLYKHMVEFPGRGIGK